MCIFTRGQTINGGDGAIGVTIEAGLMTSTGDESNGPDFSDASKAPDQPKNNNLPSIDCQFTLIKQGDVVTKTKTGVDCDNWDAHTWGVEISSNSFKASMSYY